MIICPPPEPEEPMSDRARAAADYALDAARRGVVSMRETLTLRVVQRRLAELRAAGHVACASGLGWPILSAREAAP